MGPDAQISDLTHRLLAEWIRIYIIRIVLEVHAQNNCPDSYNDSIYVHISPADH